LWLIEPNPKDVPPLLDLPLGHDLNDDAKIKKMEAQTEETLSRKTGYKLQKRVELNGDADTGYEIVWP
jgi:hypothetical protein